MINNSKYNFSNNKNNKYVINYVDGWCKAVPRMPGVNLLKPFQTSDTFTLTLSMG